MFSIWVTQKFTKYLGYYCNQFVAKNFQKLPNLITLPVDHGRSTEFAEANKDCFRFNLMVAWNIKRVRAEISINYKKITFCAERWLNIQSFWRLWRKKVHNFRWRLAFYVLRAVGLITQSLEINYDRRRRLLTKVYEHLKANLQPQITEY